MRADFWTRERIATLKRLWAEDKPATAIAKTLGGISRSAVLGKIFRLRLDTTGKPADKTRQGTKSAKQKSRQVPPKERPARRRGAAAETAAKAPRTAGRKSLLELTNQCCRWPHGQPGTRSFFFCGAAGADVENGLPYCPQHMRRAYIVPPEYSGAARPAKPSHTTSITPWRFVSKARSKARSKSAPRQPHDLRGAP